MSEKSRTRTNLRVPEFSPSETLRRTRRRWVMEGSIALIIAILTFFLGLFIFPLLLVDSFSLGNTIIQVEWDKIGTITGLATFSLVVGGVVFAYREIYNEVQRTREGSESSFRFYKELYERLMNPDSLAARRWVILNLPTLEEMKDNKEAWLKRINRELHRRPRGSKSKRSPGQEYLKHILNDFDYIGFVHENYWRIEGELAIWINPPVAKVWERIGAYVEEEAKLRNELDYYVSARRFGDYCLDWRKANRPRANVIKNAT